MLGTGSPELEVRALVGEAWARMEHGDVRAALRAARRTRGCSSRSRRSRTSTGPTCSSASASAATSSRASRRRSACSTRRSTLAERSELPVRHAALEHPELALALLPPPARLGGRARGRRARARAGRGPRTTAARSREVYFQASLIAERNGHWLLARTYAERAKAQYEELADQANVGKLLNNLGGLNFLLGKPEQAIEQLKRLVPRPARRRRRRPTRPRSSRRSRRCTSASARSSSPSSRRGRRSS